jgi:hypothetical protein
MKSASTNFIKCLSRNNDNPNSCKAYIAHGDIDTTCDALCKHLGYTCYVAYKEVEENELCVARTGESMNCYGPENNDFVCGCEKGIH